MEKVSVKAPEQRQLSRFGVFIVNFEGLILDTCVWHPQAVPLLNFLWHFHILKTYLLFFFFRFHLRINLNLLESVLFLVIYRTHALPF